MDMVNILLMVLLCISHNNIVIGLGILDDKLKFHNHPSTVTEKADSMYGS